MKRSVNVGIPGLALAIAILLSMPGGRDATTVQAVENQEGETASAARDYCDKPRGGNQVGDCAAFCDTEQECGQCCNEAFGGADEQDNYDLCIGRCDDIAWDESSL